MGSMGLEPDVWIVRWVAFECRAFFAVRALVAEPAEPDGRCGLLATLME